MKPKDFRVQHLIADFNPRMALIVPQTHMRGYEYGENRLALRLEEFMQRHGIDQARHHDTKSF